MLTATQKFGLGGLNFLRPAGRVFFGGWLAVRGARKCPPAADFASGMAIWQMPQIFFLAPPAEATRHRDWGNEGIARIVSPCAHPIPRTGVRISFPTFPTQKRPKK